MNQLMYTLCNNKGVAHTMAKQTCKNNYHAWRNPNLRDTMQTNMAEEGGGAMPHLKDKGSRRIKSENHSQRIGNNNGTQTPKIIKRIDTNKNDIK